MLSGNNQEASKIAAALQEFVVLARSRTKFTEDNQYLNQQFCDLILNSLQGEVDLQNGDQLNRDMEHKIGEIFAHNPALRDALFRQDYLEYLMQLELASSEASYYFTVYVGMISFLRNEFRRTASFDAAAIQLEEAIAARREHYPDDSLAYQIEQVLIKCRKRHNTHDPRVEAYDLKGLVFETLDLINHPVPTQIQQYQAEANSVKYTYKDHTLAAVMLAVMGVLLIAAAIAAACATFGGLAPISTVGAIVGVSLIVSGLGLVGVGSGVAGGVLLLRKNSLKRSIFSAAKCATNTINHDEQMFPMETVLTGSM